MIAILAGGRAERMGRGVKSVDTTKGLMRIPVRGGGEETLIDRTLRLLKAAGAIEGPQDVLLCVGYRAEQVMERSPESRFLKTYDPDDPTDVLPAFLQVVEPYPEQDLVFIMGDSVWSGKALEHFLSVAGRAPLVFYHGGRHKYGETFGLGVNGEDGRNLIRRGNAAESIPVIDGEIRWQLAGVKGIPPKHCRASCYEQWLDLGNLPGKLRVDHASPVNDIDWDEDHRRICAEIEKGTYGSE